MTAVGGGDGGGEVDGTSRSPWLAPARGPDTKPGGRLEGQAAPREDARGPAQFLVSDAHPGSGPPTWH